MLHTKITYTCLEILFNLDKDSIKNIVNNPEDGTISIYFGDKSEEEFLEGSTLPIAQLLTSDNIKRFPVLFQDVNTKSNSK